MQAEYTLCGEDLIWSKTKTAKTPHRHPCRCFRLWSSSAVCHRCACVACARKRAEWFRSIRIAKKQAKCAATRPRRKELTK